MIINSIQELSRFLPSLNWKIESTRLNDFIDRAQEWVTEKIIGTDIEDLLEADMAEGQEDPHAELRKLVGRVVAELAYLTAIAEMDLQLSEAGFVVQSNDAVSPASQQRTDRLVASLKERLTTDCDAVVRYLWKNSGEGKTYENWRGSFQFTYLTAAFIPRLEIVRQHMPTGCPVTDWRQFHDLIPMMAQSLKTTVAEFCSIEQIETLLEAYRDGELLSEHRSAVRQMEMAVVSDAFGRHDDAVHYSIEARSYMMKHESSFPDFVASDKYTRPELEIGDGTVANLL